MLHYIPVFIKIGNIEVLDSILGYKMRTNTSYDNPVHGSIGENTWNSRLTESLRNKGLSSADFELFFPVLKGRPRKPDIAFTNGGTHLISGKLGEDKEFDAFSSAQEYQQLIGATTNLGEVFAAIYPASRTEKFILHLLANSIHERKTWKVNDLSEMADVIYEVVQERLDELAHPSEPADAAVVRLLRQGVEILYPSAMKADEEQLKRVFGGSDFFDSMLSSSVTRQDQKEILTRAASYLFVNQVLFYTILQREVSNLYPPIELNDMASAQIIRAKYFTRVMQKDFLPIFEMDVSSLFDPVESSDGCLRVTRLIYGLSRSLSAHDLIGKIFHEIIPLELRKLVAAFYTNSSAGDLLASLSILDPNDTILDPACGSGTLLVAAYHQKMRLNQLASQEDQIKTHKLFVENQITGLDVMAFSAHLAAVQLLLQEPLYYSDALRIGTVDSTQVEVDTRIKPLGDTIREAFRQRKLDNFERGPHDISPVELIRTGAVALSSVKKDGFKLGPVDVVIMNPPFTSSRRLPSNYKNALKQKYRSNSRYKSLIKGNISYHVYFICLADKFLKAKGRLAIVMPFTTLVGGDFAGVTRFLVNNYTIEYVICGQGRMAYSENTFFSEIMLVAKKQIPPSEHKTLLLVTKSSPTNWTKGQIDLMTTLAKDCYDASNSGDNEVCSTIPFAQKELLPEGKTLTRLMAELDDSFGVAQKKLDKLLTDSRAISDFQALQKAGVFSMKVAEVVHGKSGKSKGRSLTRFGGDALIANRTIGRALMKHDRLIVEKIGSKKVVVYDKSTLDRFSIPISAIGPALRRFAYFNTIGVEGREDIAMIRDFKSARDIFHAIYGGKKGQVLFDEFKTPEWSSVVSSGSSRLVMQGRVNLAAPGTCVLAVHNHQPLFMCSFMWGFYGMNAQDEKIMSLWFNSAVFLQLLLSRLTVTGGSWVKLHGRQLEKMKVINVNRISPSAKESLLKVYDNLQNYEWKPLIDQYAYPSDERKLLDRSIISSIFDISEEEIRELQESIYQSISKSLKNMREVMDVRE